MVMRENSHAAGDGLRAGQSSSAKQRIVYRPSMSHHCTLLKVSVTNGTANHAPCTITAGDG